MPDAFPKMETREAFREARLGITPENQDVAFTYVPPSHARALDPDAVLVEGIRGVGKSFWWNALSMDTHRRFVASAFPETRLKPDTEVGLGFGENPRKTITILQNTPLTI